MTPEIQLSVGPARTQQALSTEPYDRWLAPDGRATAEFYRDGAGYVVRFPDQADFAISADLASVEARPVPDLSRQTLATLFGNSILPAIRNRLGQLHLHGSAVVVDGRAIGFVGLSRSGKSTLAAAFARAGHPFLTEDVLSLRSVADGGYLVEPQEAVLRLFADSARYLRGSSAAAEGSDKLRIEADMAMPAATEPGPLAAICMLGPGESDALTIERLGHAAALARLLRHGFILDVEHRDSLRAHFGRIGALADTTACHALDYPRDFAQLDGIVRRISGHFRDKWSEHASD